MDRCAILVDAGYLFAQGSKALTGEKDARKRETLSLNPQRAIAELIKVAEEQAAESSLLRVYWYDAGARARPSSEQLQLARLSDVKLRLGTMNELGHQKEVDSLIVMDLVELARLRAICNAVVLASDGDIRPAIEVAQNYGVRVHLLGIVDAQGNSAQAPALIAEADTTSQWAKDTVQQFLELRRPIEAISAGLRPSDTLADKVALEVAASLTESDLRSARTFWTTHKPWEVPRELDSLLIGKIKGELGGQPSEDEKRRMRAKFIEVMQQRIARELQDARESTGGE
jgi:uncharacterized LabA/DUF88 family protein